MRRALLTVAAITLSIAATAATRENGSETVKKVGNLPVTCDNYTCVESGPSQANQTPEIDDAETTGVAAEIIDRNLQKSPLWTVIKSEFPDWYEDRLEEISQLSSTATETQLSEHLLGKLAELRRGNAKHALSSNPEHLLSIARAFLVNLKGLADYSAEACSTFIAGGETSATAISLFPEPGYGNGIETHLTAVFRAVADGQKSPMRRKRATADDYEFLYDELTKIGWLDYEIDLFAHPEKLRKLQPERVCKMVQDWVAANLSISDTGVRQRLLVETLRGVVSE